MVWNGMERKFRYGIWKMPEWNGKQSFILPYQFQTRFCALHLQKNTYRCRVVINNIITEVFIFNIYVYYLSTNRGTLVVYIAQTVYVSHHCKYIAICSIDAIVDNFNRFDLFFFFFEIDSLPRPKFCFLTSSRKLVFVASFPFQLNFIPIFSFSAYNDSFWC